MIVLHSGHYFQSGTSLMDDFSARAVVTSVLKHFLMTTLLNESNPNVNLPF